MPIFFPVRNTKTNTINIAAHKRQKKIISPFDEKAF
jgi:hypothetical protein